MSNPIEFKLTGFKELADKLHALGPAIERKGLNGAAYLAADVVRKAVKETTAFHSRSGTLKANVIVAKRRAKPGTATYRITVRWARYRNNKANRLKGRAGKFLERNPALYGAFIEFGTSKMKARPYLRPAFLSNVDTAIEVMRVRLAQAIEDAVK